MRGVREGRGNREDIRAVDESGGIVAELTHSLEDELEAVLELSLISCVVLLISLVPVFDIIRAYFRRTATRKQCESHGRAMGTVRQSLCVREIHAYIVIGLEAELSLKRRLNGALDTTLTASEFRYCPICIVSPLTRGRECHGAESR